MAFTLENSLPSTELTRDMQIAASNLGQARTRDFVENKRATGDFPRIKFFFELVAVVPQVIGLFFDLAGPYGVRRNRNAALRTDRAGERLHICIGGQVLINPYTDNVRRTVVRKCILREFKAWNHQHFVLLPGTFRFRLQNLHIERERGRRQAATNVRRRLTKNGLFFTQVVGNRDDTEAVLSVQVDELGDG